MHVWSMFSDAPSKVRNVMLRGILTQCCFPQLSYLSASVGDLIRIDFVAALPTEISLRILCFLDTSSLCKAAQVSRRWRTLADDDVVWYRMCEQHIDRKCTKCGWGLPLLERKRFRASKRQIELRAMGQGSNGSASVRADSRAEATTTPDDEGIHVRTVSGDMDKPLRKLNQSVGSKRGLLETEEERDRMTLKRSRTCSTNPNSDAADGEDRVRPWKDVYRDRFRVCTNWKYGRCSVRTFRGHTNGVMCLQFDNAILATGSYDATIKIWDIKTGQELRTLRGHALGVRALQFDQLKLISGSIDRSLKVWNWRTGECMSTYTGHNAGVISLHFDSSILASGSMDMTIKVWNFEARSAFVLRGHTDWVNDVKVQAKSNALFSASDDCTVRLWNLATKSCVRVFEGHVGQIQQVVPLPLEVDFDDGTTSSSEKDLARQAHQPLSSSFQPESAPAPSDAYGDHHAEPLPVSSRYILTGALDSTIRLWDVASGECIRTFFGHVEGIWSLAADAVRIVSAAQDRMVKIWDARSGRCEGTFTGHAGPVTCIGLSDSRLCTGSEDCEVRLYSFQSDASITGDRHFIAPNSSISNAH